LRVAESPSARHQSAVMDLFRALDAHVRARRLGRMWIAPLDVVLSGQPAIVVQPDLFFISTDREFMIHERVYGAPDLAIEVLSPTPRIGSTEERIGWFAEFGVRECWLVNLPDLTLTIVRFAEHRIAARDVFRKDVPLVSTVLPDFTPTLQAILESEER